MVTLITEQLGKQSLEEPSYRKAFSLNVSLPEVGASPTVSWAGYGFPPESSWSAFPSSRVPLQDPPSFLDSLPSSLPSRDSFCRPPVPSASVTDLSPQSSPPPPPPPPKRHCRSLSVPEDLSRCRTPWRPSASRIWTPVKRRCHSGGGAAWLGSAIHRAPGSSLTTSSLHSSSSPTFFSLALSSDSPLPWTFPWDSWDTSRGGCTSFPTPSSCSSSPVPLGFSCSSQPLLQRRFSLSPVHVRHQPCHRAPSPASRAALGRDHRPAPSPSSACSTPSSSRRAPRPVLPRCHSQPCDMRKPRLKRRHDSDMLPCARPGLDFSKMTQIGSGEFLVCGASPCLGQESALGGYRGAFSPAEMMGRTSIGPLSESEEEEEDEEEEEEEEEATRNAEDLEDRQQNVFERDCTELDLNLIEEN